MQYKIEMGRSSPRLLDMGALSRSTVDGAGVRGEHVYRTGKPSRLNGGARLLNLLAEVRFYTVVYNIA